MREPGEEPDFRFHLDTPEAKWLGGNRYYLAGWFLPMADEQARLVLQMEDASEVIEPGFPRPDVGRHHRVLKALHCGFVAKFLASKDGGTVDLKVRTRDALVSAASDIRVPPAPQFHRPEGESRVASYTEWLETIEPKLFLQDGEIPERLSRMAFRPRIQVQLSLNFADPYFVRASLESIRSQHYPNWSLSVADLESADSSTRTYFEIAAAADARIQLGTSLGDGADFVAPMAAADELHPFALLEVANFLNNRSEAELIYTDLDRIDPYGCRAFPFFKPDFDWEMFRSFDYLSGLAVLRTDLARKAVAARRPSRGQESTAALHWELLLRAAEAADASAIQHIPKVLYHKRLLGGRPEAESPANTVERGLLMNIAFEHNRRTGLTADVEPGFIPSVLRRTPQAPLKAAIVIRCEDGMFQFSNISFNVDRRTTAIYELIDCLVYRDETGTGRKLIRSLDEMEEGVLIFVHGVLETVSHRFSEEMAAHASRADCGLAGGFSVDTSLHVLSSGYVRDRSGALIDPYLGMRLSDLGRFAELTTVRTVEAVSPCFFAARKNAIQELGGLPLIASAVLPNLASQLTGRAESLGLRVIVTPYAIATFDMPAVCLPEDVGAQGGRPRLRVNPNLAAFQSVSATLADA